MRHEYITEFELWWKSEKHRCLIFTSRKWHAYQGWIARQNNIEASNSVAVALLRRWYKGSTNNEMGLDCTSLEADTRDFLMNHMVKIAQQPCPNGENNNESQPSLSCKGCKRRGDELEGKCLSCRRFNGVRIDWWEEK